MKLKQVPEDFAVSEIIEVPKKTSGDQTYFWLTKKNWTTDSAVREIARRLGISGRRFKFAGSKDKVAVTKQLVSVFKISAERLQGLELRDISLEIAGQGDKPVSLGTLTGNSFAITVRDLAKKDLNKLKRNFHAIKKSGFKNYFGEQRFGIGNTSLIGKAILRGLLGEAVKEMLCFTAKDEGEERKGFRKFARKNWGKWKAISEKVPKSLGLEKSVVEWLVKQPNDFAGALRTLPKHVRKLHVYAYQSYLWNSALAKVKSPRRKGFPVPGFKTKLGKDAFSEEIKKLLKKDSLDLESFLCKRMPELAVEGDMRKALIKPKKLKVYTAEKDELNPGTSKILLNFELPKGCYATVLLKFLFS